MEFFANKLYYNYLTNREKCLRAKVLSKSADGYDFRWIVSGKFKGRFMPILFSILLTPAAIFRTRERKTEGAHG